MFEYALQYWRAGGGLLWPLAVVCYAIWFYFLRTRKRILVATDEAAKVAGILRVGKRAELADVPSDIAAYARQWLHSGMAGGAALRAFDDENERMAGMLKKDIIILAALTAVAPLLGLIGTVVGMMQTFNAVSASSSEIAVRVASGVSRALITTQVGLVVAIPGVFGIARLRRLAEHLQVQLGAVKLQALLVSRDDGGLARKGGS